MPNTCSPTLIPENFATPSFEVVTVSWLSIVTIAPDNIFPDLFFTVISVDIPLATLPYCGDKKVMSQESTHVRKQVH